MSHSRFKVTYRIFTIDKSDATQRAEGIALEQTVEIPRDVVPKGYVEDIILGKVESVTQTNDQAFDVVISYAMDSIGDWMSQLINVIFGNSSIQKGIKVIGFTPCPTLTQQFAGANFGINGIRKLTNRQSGGLIAPVIKPQGCSSDLLADMCYRTARAGADIIKEDHGLANQPTAPFLDRIKCIVNAVSQANEDRGNQGDTTRALYFACLGPGHGSIYDTAMYAKDAGVDGVLLMPGIYGFDTVYQLASNNDFNLPIMAHPAHLGPYVLSEDTGYTHGMMLGTMMRLIGADISIFPNYGGRFGFNKDECLDIVNACTTDQGYGRPILPSPGGGMTLDHMPELQQIYRQNSVYLLGGDLLKYKHQIDNKVQEIRSILDI